MTAETDAIVASLEAQYMRVRTLPDGSIAALGDLLFTRAIFLDCDRLGYGARYCFKDRDLAAQRFDELQGADDVPAGHIANR